MSGPVFFKYSLTDPAGVTRRLMQEDLPMSVLWSLLVLVSILSVLLVELGSLAATGSMAVQLSPFLLTLVLTASLTILVFAILLTGRAMGGTGRLDQTILLVSWWQGIGLAIQIAQTVVLVVLPPLAGLVTLVGLAWLIFALLHFVNELHNFGNLFKALGTVLLGILGFSFGIAILLTLLGVSVQGGPV